MSVLFSCPTVTVAMALPFPWTACPVSAFPGQAPADLICRPVGSGSRLLWARRARRIAGRCPGNPGPGAQVRGPARARTRVVPGKPGTGKTVPIDDLAGPASECRMACGGQAVADGTGPRGVIG